ncbi:MAG: pentapeptide repeat-containing protein [Ktedonobacterales bacterium]
MSDESGQSGQEQPEEQAPKWGDPISPERQAELQGYLNRWQSETDHGERKGPLDGIALTGADLSWLADQSERDGSGLVPNLHLEGAFLSEASLQGAFLRGAHLERSNLMQAYLEGAELASAHLEGADLRAAHLEHADLTATWFDKESSLGDTILTSVSLDQISFDQTNLTVVDWSLVTILGDEQTARVSKDTNGKPKTRATLLG